MDKALKQRLVGATVLIILTVIILPMLLSGRSDTLNTESRQIELPPRPEELSFETRRFPVGVADKPVKPARQNTSPGAKAATLPQTAIDDLETGSDTAGTTMGAAPTPTVPATVVAPPAVTTVTIEPPENTTKIEPETDTGQLNQPRYLVQVASFSSEQRANAMAAELRSEKMPVVMDVVDRTAGRLHRVRVGPYIERSAANAVMEKIHAMNQALSPRILDTRPDDSAPVSAPSDPLVRWVVQVGSYSSAGPADAEVAKLRLLGLTAFSEKVTSTSGTAYKVRIGPEINRDNAVQLAKTIKAKHHIDGFVTSF